MSTTHPTSPLTARACALLRAVSQGRAEISCSCEPDMFVDGLCCCDQSTVHSLCRSGLIAPASAAPLGSRVSAVLTVAGAAALEVHPA